MASKSDCEILHDELKALYPSLAEDELVEAGHNLDAYIEVVLVIHDQVRRDPETYQRFLALTSREPVRHSDAAEPIQLFPPDILTI